MTSKPIYFCVYRITNIVEKKHYYGYKSSKIHPSKVVGVTYFSSSRSKEFIADQKENPQNYKYKIVQIFDSKDKALSREIKLHNKFDVGTNINFYNKAKQTSIGFDTSGKTLAKTLSGTKLGMVDINDPRWATGEIVSLYLGVKTGPAKKESKFKGVKRNTAAAVLVVTNTSLGMVDVNDPRWDTGEIASPNKGKQFTQEHKDNIKKNHADCGGSKNSFYGKTHSIESKNKIGSRDYSSISKAIIVNGIRYKSTAEAEFILSIPRGIISRLLISGKFHPKYDLITSYE